MRPAPAVSVVICTYNRPRMLEAAVASCLADATRLGLPFEIVIADNSPTGHAAPLVAGLAQHRIAVRLVPAAPPNISIARNAGLRAAHAPLVAFLDDDLQVDVGWLDAFVATLSGTGADVAVGPVRPRFSGGEPPAWDPQASRFTRVLPVPSGTPIIAGGAQRTRDFSISTASSIWRASRCFADREPFDPAFGACGGEDRDLFLRLEAKGCRFVWCAEAGVRETIPAERAALWTHVLRTYSGAQVYAATSVKNADAPVRTSLDVMTRGAAQAAASGTLVPLLLPFGAPRWQQRLLAAASGLGKLLWWQRLPVYHVEKPSEGKF